MNSLEELRQYQMSRKVQKYRKILLKDINYMEKVGEGTFG